MEFDLNKWVNLKRTGSVLLEHVGDFTSDYIDTILPSMEEKLYETVEFDNVRKKTFHIFVECIQNLYHHIESIDVISNMFGTDRMGAIFLIKDGSFCRVTTGNFVRKTQVPTLKEHINKLNTLTEAEIKMLYRDTINNKSFSAKGGAGIGMIDMARKTGNKLQYQFYTVSTNPELLFFSFDVCIS